MIYCQPFTIDDKIPKTPPSHRKNSNYVPDDNLMNEYFQALSKIEGIARTHVLIIQST